MNRKASWIYSQIWLSGPQSPLPPGETGTTFFSPSFSHSPSAPFPLCAHLCVGCWAQSRHNWTHPCPWVRIIVGWGGGLWVIPMSLAWKWSPGEASACLRWYTAGEGTRAQHRQSSGFHSFAGMTTSQLFNKH